MGRLFDIIVAADNMKRIQRGMKFMRSTAVLVGIPQAKTDRKAEEGDVTNAELLFIHTNGSPVNNIPKRPVIEPALEKDADRLSDMMKKAATLAMDGKEELALKQLKLVGMRGQNVSRAYFLDPENGWPPNSPSVAAEKRKKKSTDPKPLIDTGELRKSITYVIEKGGRRMS